MMGAAQADLGSVELLYPSSVGQPLYFDVNMLSTLPNPAEVDDPHGLWPTGFDPWKEQADFITQKACHRQTEQLN